MNEPPHGSVSLAGSADATLLYEVRIAMSLPSNSHETPLQQRIQTLHLLFSCQFPCHFLYGGVKDKIGSPALSAHICYKLFLTITRTVVVGYTWHSLLAPPFVASDRAMRLLCLVFFCILSELSSITSVLCCLCRGMIPAL